MNKKINLRTLCEVAILVALEVVLTRFCGINVMTTKIGFGFVPMALCGMLFGPWWTAAAYALADIIGCFLFPVGPYVPVFTLTAALMGLTFGFFLHGKEQVKFFPHIVCVVVIYAIVLSYGLNTMWITVLYGSTYTARLVTRLPQCLFTVATMVIILPLLNTLTRQLRRAGLVA